MDDIAAAQPASLFVGAFDLAKAMNIEPNPNTNEILRARREIAGAAKRVGIASFDMPFIHLTDNSGLDEHIDQSKYLGFTGGAAVNGEQAARINAAFTSA